MIYKKIDNKCTKAVVDNSKYLDMKLENSKNALILHNVNIEHRGENVTIDHILISRMGIEILKSKNFENREIDIGGDSALIIDNQHYSNPLEIIKKEKAILESFLEEKLTFSSNKYWFVDSRIRIDATVVFGAGSNIINEKLPIGFDRIEDYLSHREERISKMSKLNAFKVLASMLSAKMIKEIASLLSVYSIETVYSNEDIDSKELIAS